MKRGMAGCVRHVCNGAMLRHSKTGTKPIDWWHNNDGGFSTLAAAVALLVTLALLASALQLHWLHQRSQETQVVADAAALAGANVLAKIHTAYTVCDALSLSMGLTGAVTMASSIVCAAIPGAQEISVKAADLSVQIFDARATFNTQVNKAFSAINQGLPVVVAMQSMTVIDAYHAQGQDYVGCALPVPLHPSFNVLDTDAFSEELTTGRRAQQELSSSSQELEAAQQQAQKALEQGWMADCGNTPRSLYERTGHLSGLSGAHNPYYATPAAWNFGVALTRAQCYYDMRERLEAPHDYSPEEYARSAARKAFYRYAGQELQRGYYSEDADGHIHCWLPHLPRNTDEIKQTSLYTEAMWPTSVQDGKRVLHPGPHAPGIEGELDGFASLADLDAGAVFESDVTHFNVHTLGKTPLASTAIDNGFEYYWELVADAADKYQQAKDKERRIIDESMKAARPGVEAFESALSKLSRTQPLDPQEIYKGCVSVVFEPHSYQAPCLLGTFSPASATLSARGAVSAARLMPDNVSVEHNVLSQFFNGLKHRAGVEGAAGTVGDAVFECWGGMLLAYEEGYTDLEHRFKLLLDGCNALGLSKVSSALTSLFTNSIHLAGFAPVDLRTHYPVLCHTSHIFTSEEGELLKRVQRVVMSLPPESSLSSPADVVRAMTGVACEGFDMDEISLGILRMPGSDRPITVSIDIGGASNHVRP